LTDTGSRDLAWFLEGVPSDLDRHTLPSDANELARQSMEALIVRQLGNARALRSEGYLRLHGGGVTGNSAPLDVVGKISLAWQKAVGAVGAALEGIQSPLGKLPGDITARTRLSLTASPLPGSILLHVTPEQDPLIESEPGGDRAMANVPRPLADRASERLISLLTRVGHGEAADLDEITTELRSLGPRVGSAVAQFAREVDKGDLIIDATWQEPEASLVATTIDVPAARFISNFIEGQELDGVEELFDGVLATVSVSEQWLVVLEDETVHMDASGLASDIPALWRVGQMVHLRVHVTVREQPDGTTRRKFRILDVAELVNE
jgi:hypothetical protein